MIGDAGDFNQFQVIVTQVDSHRYRFFKGYRIVEHVFETLAK